ncbi:TerD family protein [Paenibacillus sp. WQ 127069]|uniref:TerD family protein n=1 Tax=Paenibacillus baimaensis TaxID=2982185 RepID=A0ABT2U8B4_9BACL|nr:TerD family protein [Paenibacillus sp. WQ 127069]MCU6790825.1 TerD family protein [Paenibacillus sp. WQ 127069]
MANPITNLLTGANTTLVKEPLLEVTVSWESAPAGLDMSCFMIGGNGKVPSDDYFIFYNQPADPQQLVEYKATEAKAIVFSINLDKLLATEIDKCVFAATLDGPGTFKGVNGCKVTGHTSQADIVYEIKEAGDETSLVLVELYRHQGWWKLRAIGRGFNGGLQPLAEAHGVSVADEENEAVMEAEDTASSPVPAAIQAGNESSAPVPTPAPANAPANGTKPTSVFADQAASTSVFSSQSRSASIFALQPATTSLFDAQRSRISMFDAKSGSVVFN